MNIIFFGSSQFAVPSLEAILDKGHTVSCVVTRPDRKKDRGMHFKPMPVKLVAQNRKLKIYQPQDVNSQEAVELLGKIKPDLFVVIAYGKFLSQELLELPKILSINLHASLLPIYRGAAPINWAMINGEEVTGVSVIKMTREMDAGPIISQKKTVISADEDALQLEQRLSRLGAELLLDVIEDLSLNNHKLIEQDSQKVSFAPKIKKGNGQINWSAKSRQVFNLVRGVAGWPGAFTYYKGKLLKIYKASVSDALYQKQDVLPGEVLDISKEGLVVNTGSGALVILQLQPEGKRVMSAQEFISGHKISPGEILGKK
ncbi:MAG: methionyl-tRNA formyltransferase [Candidatus Omnitrophota bacterium]